MIPAMEKKINLKPVFSNRVHTAAWEGPCRTGKLEELTEEYERKLGEEEFARWKPLLEKKIDPEYTKILDPVYMEWDETYVVKECELKKVEKDIHETDIFLFTYRVPGLIEKYHKPMVMMNLGPTPIDLVAYYTDIGEEAYMVHDYEELNMLLRVLQVKKAISSTKLLILSGTEHIPVSVNSSIHDLPMLQEKYGIRNSRVSFRLVFDEMERVAGKNGKIVERNTEALIEKSVETNIPAEDLAQDLTFYHAVKSLMNKYECNAFTIPCMNLCATRIPALKHFVPCITHTLLKDEKYPTSCEEDISVWMAVMVLMYLSEKSVFMGNPVLVKKGHYEVEEIGIMKGMVSKAKPEFDEEVLEIHHSVPGMKMNGFENDSLPYKIGHFTHEGWGGKIQIDMNENSEKKVTFARFNRSADSMFVGRGEIIDIEFREEFCSPAIFIKTEGNVRELRQKLAKGRYGHHLAVVYGDYADSLRQLGEIMNFNVEVYP